MQLVNYKTKLIKKVQKRLGQNKVKSVFFLVKKNDLLIIHSTGVSFRCLTGLFVYKPQ